MSLQGYDSHLSYGHYSDHSGSDHRSYHFMEKTPCCPLVVDPLAFYSLIGGIFFGSIFLNNVIINVMLMMMMVMMMMMMAPRRFKRNTYNGESYCFYIEDLKVVLLEGT